MSILICSLLGFEASIKNVANDDSESLNLLRVQHYLLIFECQVSYKQSKSKNVVVHSLLIETNLLFKDQLCQKCGHFNCIFQADSSEFQLYLV